MSEEATVTESINETPSMVPVKVDYCPHCGMPFDFCDFGDMWHTGVCQKECIKRYPEIFGTEESTINQLAATSISNKRKIKVPKEVVQEITIQRSTRSKRKIVTSIIGLDLFGIKLDAAAKTFSKHFATGATVVKSVPGQPDKVDIQGDVQEALIELLLANYPEITPEKITRLPSKLK
ncbi:bifunctional SUI1 domain/SUI1 domain superfamily [Babesia duncani]|uniref:Bifunctional SUI1 domain/SUI1 domain superfamily n=1 Tax=Babesia duncani TaxID=323732 RepID=A0AAD9PL37_9APIC|nr:bifunctional SUI1 domain/SUI1 domain superfamily [Babesia duncani]